MKKNIAFLLLVFTILSCKKQEDNNTTSEESLFPNNEGSYNSGSGGGPLEWPNDRVFKLPLQECIITQSFANKNENWSNQFHLGVDLAANPLENVYAVGDGEVVFSTFRPNKENGQNWGGIFVLQITEPENFYIIYGHVDEKNIPNKGTDVKKGNIISKIEKKDVHTWQTHLHFQLGYGDFKLEANRVSPPGYAVNLNTEKWADPFQYLSTFKITFNDEVCNCIDDNSNGLIDELKSCWVTIYRFKAPDSEARCWNNTTKPPTQFPNYTFEIEAWVAMTYNTSGTFNLVQCSKLTDNILVEKNSSDYYSLINAGYSQTADLGYVWRVGNAITASKYFTVNHKVCKVYRFSYSLQNGLGAHFFTRGADNVSTMSCEPPARFEAITTHQVFNYPPCY